MPTTTNVEQVKLNVMTKTQYASATKNPNELYAVTDADGTTTEQSIDAEIVGNLTVSSNSDISNFYSGIDYDNYTRYLKFPGQLDFSGSSSFEIRTAITNDSSNAIRQILRNKGTTGIGFVLGVNNGKKVFFNTSLNGAVGPISLVGTTALSANTKYFIKVVYDGSSYTLSLSTDDVNYTAEATTSSTYTFKPEGEIIMCPDGATLHMADCYIKKNDIIIWQGMDAPGLHQRVVKGHEVIAFQAPTAGNNYTWYRKYADGWVEQGGHTTSQNVTFPITMADTNYHVLLTGTATQSNNNVRIVGFRDATTTSMVLQCNVVNQSSQTSVANDGIKYWEVKGMAQ